LAAAFQRRAEDLMRESLVLLDVEPSRDYFLSLFRDRGLNLDCVPAEISEMVRGFVGHGLGYSLLATKPATQHDLRRPRAGGAAADRAVKNSRLVLATLSGRSMSPMASEFAEHSAMRSLASTMRTRRGMARLRRAPICARRRAKLITCRPKQSPFPSRDAEICAPTEGSQQHSMTRRGPTGSDGQRPNRAAKPGPDWRGEDPI